ncbi:MAG TPA: LamG domain-containing protein, partial [Polyangium sp.]|nr:LamG domain-containing protein [Polyangium sp.]
GSLSTIVTGQIGEAVYFNQNQFIKIGSSSLVAVNTNEARTIEAWVKSTYDKQDQEIVWQESQCIGWHLGTTMAGNFWGSFVVNSTMNYCTAQTDANVESTSALDWRYLALVIDRPKGSMSLYVDGQVTKTTPIDNTGYADGSGDFTIGAEYSGAKAFLGDMDEVRISDHARAPAWIEAQYRSMRDDFLTFAPFEVP